VYKKFQEHSAQACCKTNENGAKDEELFWAQLVLDPNEQFIATKYK